MQCCYTVTSLLYTHRHRSYSPSPATTNYGQKSTNPYQQQQWTEFGQQQTEFGQQRSASDDHDDKETMMRSVTHTHTHAHTQKYTYTYSDAQTYTHTHTHATYRHIYTRTHTHTDTLFYKVSHKLNHTHAQATAAANATTRFFSDLLLLLRPLLRATDR
jgi:hypothetical protein